MRFLFLLLLPMAISSCVYMDGKMIRGNGKMTSQQRDAAGSINGVNLKGSIDVAITQGSNSIRVEGDENLVPYVTVENNNGVLAISTRPGYSINSDHGLKVYISAPSFTIIRVSGSGNIESNSKITNNEKIDVQVSGSGDATLEVDTPQLNTEVDGSGNVTLKGRTQSFSASIRGSGDVQCFNLLSETGKVNIAGSGTAQVFASKQLSVDIKGSGDVQYKGTPSLNQNIHGSGSVSKAG